MHIIIKPQAFTSALHKLLGVTNTKGPLTIVANALLTATDDNRLKIQGTDLELTVSTEIDCETKMSGQLLLNAHSLFNIVKGLTGDAATLIAEDNSWARLRSGKVDCRIVGFPPSEFPRLPLMDETTEFSLETHCLLEMIERTIFSISNDEGRPNLMGAYFVIRDGTASAVSTDGHRLCRVVRQVDNAADAPDAFAEGVIIPKKSLTEIRRTIDVDAKEVYISVSGNNAMFQFADTTIMVRLVDASFPDYTRVIPAEIEEKQAIVGTAEFAQKMNFVSLFANQRTSNILLMFDEGVLQLDASDPETGEGTEVLDIKYSGPKVQVGFNYKYFIDVLGVINEPFFRFQVIDAFSAVIIHDGDNLDDLFLIMPMRP